MRWSATYFGEITNATYYFSSFGNVFKYHMDTVNGSLGTSDDDTWHPWEYQERLENADKIKVFKESLKPKNYRPATERDKMLKVCEGRTRDTSRV